MKKILILLVILISVYLSIPDLLAVCNPEVDANFDIWWSLNDCLKGSHLVNWEDVEIKAWWEFTKQIQRWVNNISLYLWVLAVWSIVFGSLMMTFSWWEDEKLKKAKDIVKWGIIWFVWLISVTAIVNLIVKIMYSI